ncbi:bifunctional 5,10-methylenetetrahydrofolate dehydrogenase/5,10-methenyltetrahydrofolate cyclohydrolase [Candidatus Saccharibacteria bacterium]|nr:bifunctional 5,10-methylenetetrahydrofolate dehydrogenase/5,10-methenyltetrahydrofolate cyclohydrolase [Candidatus Saccharibacteria bacterium]
MKILDGKELAGFIKERQFSENFGLGSGGPSFGLGDSNSAGFSRRPKLLIIRDSENPVILKYVKLKIRYGEDIGVSVEDFYAKNSEEIREKILAANSDAEIDGIILQLPILEKEKTDELTSLIAPEKDVDGLSGAGKFESATATAILWLLAGYDISLNETNVALVGRGKLVGRPLLKMFKNSGVNVSLFHRGDDLTELKNFDIIITATGVPGLIKSEMVKPGAVVVDAGTASEKGILVGDVSEEVRARNDLKAITPKVGGVGPLTVTCLFEHVIQAYNSYAKKS